MRSVRRFLPLGWRWWVIAVAIGLVAVPPVRRVVESALVAVSQPLFALSHDWRPGDSTRQITHERDVLRDQVAVLTGRLAEAQQQLEIHASLSELTTYISHRHDRSVIARVIAYSPDPGIETMTISRGLADGVAAGQAVITNNGFFLGKIQTVTAQTSTVLLLTDSQTKIAARVQNASQSLGIVSGQRGLTIEMNFIPKNDEVKPGQTVVTAGSETHIPPDVVIGTIYGTTSRSGELFRRATIISPVQISRVRAVAVLIDQP